MRIITPMRATGRNEVPGMITDGLGATGYRGRVAERLVDIDLGKVYGQSYWNDFLPENTVVLSG